MELLSLKVEYVNLMEKTGFVVHFFPPTLFNEKFQTWSSWEFYSDHLSAPRCYSQHFATIPCFSFKSIHLQHLLLKNKFVIDINLEKKISILHGKLVSLTQTRKLP